MSKHAQLLKIHQTIFLGAIEEGVLTLSIFRKNLLCYRANENEYVAFKNCVHLSSLFLSFLILNWG